MEMASAGSFLLGAEWLIHALDRYDGGLRDLRSCHSLGRIMTALSNKPGTIEIKFAGEDAKHLALMAKASKTSVSRLARSLIRELIRDDRTAHEQKEDVR